jgi:hypothetical protein
VAVGVLGLFSAVTIGRRFRLTLFFAFAAGASLMEATSGVGAGLVGKARPMLHFARQSRLRKVGRTQTLAPEPPALGSDGGSVDAAARGGRRLPLAGCARGRLVRVITLAMGYVGLARGSPHDHAQAKTRTQRKQ